MLQQEDVLDNGGQAEFRKGTVQTSFHERRPFPLQCPLAAHIPLNIEAEQSVMCSFLQMFQEPQVQQYNTVSHFKLLLQRNMTPFFPNEFLNFTLQTRATRDTATLL